MSVRRALAIAAIGLLPLAGCGDDEDGESGPSGSASPAAFEVELPPGWEEADQDQLDQLTQAAITQTAAALGIPEEEATIRGEALWFYSDSPDNLRTNVNVISEDTGSLEDEDYIDASVGSIERVAGFADLEETGTVDVGGDEARDVAYTGSDGALRFRAAILVHDESGFNITLTSSPEEFDAASADFDELLASWEWAD